MNEKNLKEQLAFTPKLEGGLSQKDLAGYDNVIIGGVGGSALAARTLFFLDPTFPAWLHDDYGLPVKNEGKTLYVAISYSGNTAETLSFAKKASEAGHSLIAITSGGELLNWSLESKVPHILIPSGFKPRDCVLYMLRALLYAINRTDLFVKPEEGFIDFQKVFEHGREIGKNLEKKIPLIYASRSNQTLSYIWKIMLNETGKIPAFANYFPELVHNEAQGIIPKTAGALTENLKILLLLDKEDDERISRGMNVFQDLASSQGVEIISVDLPLGKTNKLLYVLAAASSASKAIAEAHGVDASSVPFIDLFKKSMLLL